MARENIYRGLSFTKYSDSKTLSLRDIELVKCDLLNHIYTRLGERFMMPTFGTAIMDMPFEQLDDETLLTIEDDLITVINFDPRVEFRLDEVGIPTQINVEALYDENAVIASIDLNYIELDVSETLDIRLEFSE